MEEVEREEERKPLFTLTGSDLTLSFFYDSERDRVSISVSRREGGSFVRVGSIRTSGLEFVLKLYRIVKQVRSKYLEDLKEFVE